MAGNATHHVLHSLPQEAIMASDIIAISLLTLLVITAIAVVSVRNLLASTAYLMVFSLIMALLYLVLAAPDVAMTEAAIGAGISTVLLLGAILHVGETERRSRHPFLPIFVIVICGAALIYAALSMPDVGGVGASANSHVGKKYLEVTGPQTAIPNVVTAVLAYYRGYDTMGETVVVFTAAIAVLLLLGKDVKASRKKRPGGEDSTKEAR